MTEQEHKIEIATHFGRLFERMDNQDKVLNQIKDDSKEAKNEINKVSDKVGIQNGRVRKLEDWSESARIIIENSSNLIGTYKIDKAKIWTAGVVIVFLGGAIITLAIMAIDTKIEKGIEAALSSYEIDILP